MSQFISVFEMLKIGIGPSSSHTLGPWRAAQEWVRKITKASLFDNIDGIKIDLYGSLSLTGKGHATDTAILLGLSGMDPETILVENIHTIVKCIQQTQLLNFNTQKELRFSTENIVFHKKFLPFHANGITFRGFQKGKEISTETYYSIGGGFVIQQGDSKGKKKPIAKQNFPFPIHRGKHLEDFCKQENKSISEIVLQNELILKSKDEIDFHLHKIWDTMLECMYIGCHTEGKLPGGLQVKRRAFETHKKLIKNTSYTNYKNWIPAIRSTEVKFREILKWEVVLLCL